MHVSGRAELYELKGELGLRAATLERVGVGGHLVALERLKRELAAEGLFAPERKRRLPRVPRAVGILTGADTAARGDFIATLGRRFPATKAVVCETRVQGRGAPESIVAGLRALAAHPEVDVVVLTRGGGSFEDLLPFSAESVVRAVASCPVPVVSAVGHEQDTPLCDLAADARAATPTAAAALVVPDQRELRAALETSRQRLQISVRRLLERDATSLGARESGCVRRLACSSSGGARPSTTPAPGCRRSLRSRPSHAGTRSSARAVRRCARPTRWRPANGWRSSSPSGSLGARVEEVRP